ncbi:hypothetical protein SKAU_G00326090 [Synaphobranchus kaupii]|uniref:Uncharacterized protein n=1 Tax=Synaphobranchus kaupii TaxID=118154 RepID=A0A9Q1EPV5_SYNKA|nr:hypothetical protein SKAU_G00326090 [Synaphobranchus kaupii]
MGPPLVPVFSFGENEVFNQVDNPRGTWLRWVQERLQRMMGISLPPVPRPRRLPVQLWAHALSEAHPHCGGCTVVQWLALSPHSEKWGKPIPVEKNEKPSDEELSDLHEHYMSELSQLFEEHKGKYGVPEDKHLTFV